MQLLQLRQISFHYQTAAKPLFDDLDFTLNAGDCQMIHGHTGSGKSTLLKLILGVMERPFAGERHCAPQLCLGVVMQDPNVQLLRQTLGAEVAFALENLGVAATGMHAQVSQALRKVGLFISLETPIETLSLGQRYRLMIAAQLVLQPDILLLDEPWAQLDNQGVQELTVLLAQLQQSGMAIVIVEHHKRAFSSCVTHRWLLDAGQLHPYQENDAELEPALLGITGGRTKPNTSAMQAPVIHAAPFKVGFSGQPLLFQSAALRLYPGEIVALTGDNGTGKSTLLKCLAGIQADVGNLGISVLNQRPKLGVYGHQLALLHQRPSRQLFESSVIEEMQFSLKRYGLPLERAPQMLARLGLSALASQSPHQLSYGQQHLVALASLACLQPQILLLDDPFAGLDSGFFCQVAKLILTLSEQGCAIVLASHRPLDLLPIDQVWHISDKRMQCFAGDGLTQNEAYSRVG